MKNLIYCIMTNLLISVNMLNAQSIKVVYQEQFKTPDNIKQLNNLAIESAVSAQLGKMNKTTVLYYENGMSLFEQLAVANESQQSFQDNVNVQTIQMGSGGTYYKNRKRNESVSKEYIMDKAFLITEPLSSEWKLLSEKRKIGNYLCKKAINDKNITAWYCPEIPISDGPYLFQGLPGLILEVEMPTKTITMQDIEFDAAIKDKIQMPQNGKKISRDEFSKLLSKKKEELGVGKGKEGVSVIKM